MSAERSMSHRPATRNTALPVLRHPHPLISPLWQNIVYLTKISAFHNVEVPSPVHRSGIFLTLTLKVTDRPTVPRKPLSESGLRDLCFEGVIIHCLIHCLSDSHLSNAHRKYMAFSKIAMLKAHFTPENSKCISLYESHRTLYLRRELELTQIGLASSSILSLQYLARSLPRGPVTESYSKLITASRPRLKRLLSTVGFCSITTRVYVRTRYHSFSISLITHLLIKAENMQIQVTRKTYLSSMRKQLLGRLSCPIIQMIILSR
jgi:hypothetical protein